MIPDGSQSPYTLLIADDNRDTVATLSALVRIKDHQVIEAHDGAQALEQGQRWKPRVLVRDIGMRGLSGYQLASRIRGEPWGHRATLIAHAGCCRGEDRQRAVAAGIDHVTKPIDADAMLALFPPAGAVQGECSTPRAPCRIKSL
jgi:CheY-like chemotaxis protein